MKSPRVEWLADNLDTNEFAVFKAYMKEEVLPTVVGLEQVIDKQNK